MKKLLVLALFCLAMGLFTPKEVKAAYDDCYSGGNWGTVLCGPDIASDPNGDGSSNVLWIGESKTLGNLTVLQASLYLSKNSRVNMGNNSVLTFDGLGCKEDISSGKCDLNGDTNWGKNILSIDSSEFFHGGGNNPIFNMKDINSIRMSNNSIVTLGIIKDNNQYTMLEFSVKDSDLAINQIVFENPNSWINLINVSNSENNRGKRIVNINNGIRVSKIYGITLLNADMIIGGDVIAYGATGSGGGITPISLENSDMLLNGNEISQVGTINLVRGSNFKVDPRNGEHTIVMGGAGNPTIMLEEGSTMTAQNIKLNTPNFDLILSGEGTVFNADKIYFDNVNLFDFDYFDMDLRESSKANIGTIDTSVNCSQGCSSGGDKRISFMGDKGTSYNVDKIIIQDNNVSLRTANSAVNINNIDYNSSILKITSTVIDPKDVEGIYIGNVNFLQDATSTGYQLNFQNQKSTIDNISFKSSNTLEVNVDNSNVNLGNVSCVSCKSTTFKGIGDSSIVMKNFNSGSVNASDFQNIFTSINLNVEDTYKSSGTFNVNSSHLNFHSLVGEYDSINLINSSLTLNSKSNINLTNGAIEIDGDSSLSIKGEQTFYSSSPITINNRGELNILVANDFDTLNNDGIATLDGQSHIDTIVNNGQLDANGDWVKGILNLYNGASIETLSNNDGKIIIYGGNYIKNFDATADSNLLFKVDTKQSRPTLTIGSMINPYTGSLGIEFSSLAVLKPGLKNRYDIIKTENGSIGIDPNDFSNALNVLPPWLVHEEAIESNGNGEIAWINVQRLTDYKALIGAVPGYGVDSSIINIAALIDTNVFDTKATLGLEDVVNSLDLNSGCGLSDQLIYEVHQGIITLDISQAPCLYTMAEHMNTLKPVQNEVYALYSHTNVVKSLDTLLEANREYIYPNEIYSWYKTDMGYTSLDDKGYDSGFNSVNSMFFVGASITPWNYFNVSGMLGFGLGNLNGNNSLFDGTTNSFTAGLAGSYLSNDYYVSISSVIGLTNFHTDRNIAFLDNSYSDNRDTLAKSSLSVLELALKTELGKEYIVTSTTFLTPKIFASQSILRNSGYEEFGSSASLTVDASNLLITDVGVGFELRRELLLPAFLGINTAFWYPKFGMNLVERFYNAPDTKMKFYGVSDDTYANILGADYSGILGQVYASLLYQSQAFAIQAGYNGDMGVSGYMNHSINAVIKYSFR